MVSRFGLFLFSVDDNYVTTAFEAGIDGVVVDWEHIGKAERQKGADTQINYNTVDDLRRIRQLFAGHIICRINNVPMVASQEAQQAIDHGADEILIPMVRRVDEVEKILTVVNNQVQTSVMVETLEAIQIAGQLAQLPLARVYVGLNDLALQSNMLNIFENVHNGTVEQLSKHFVNLPFGFGGLTIPTSGEPIPSRLLMGEMVRLNCAFTFLRRSFLRDTPRHKLQTAVVSIRQALELMTQRSPDECQADQDAMLQRIFD